MRAYFDRLVAGGVTGYSFDDLWRDYRLSHLVNTSTPVLVGATMDLANERGVELIATLGNRHFAAAVDLDAVALIPPSRAERATPAGSPAGGCGSLLTSAGLALCRGERTDLHERPAAVHQQRLADHVRRRLAAQEQHGAGDVARHAAAARAGCSCCGSTSAAP